MEFGLSRTIQLANSSLAGRRAARELVADQLRAVCDQVGGIRFELSRDVELSSNLSATGRKLGLRPAREPLQICQRPAIDCQRARQWVIGHIPLRCPARQQLASRLLADRRPARKLARELVRQLDRVMEFGLKRAMYQCNHWLSICDIAMAQPGSYGINQQRP